MAKKSAHSGADIVPDLTPRVGLNRPASTQRQVPHPRLHHVAHVSKPSVTVTSPRLAEPWPPDVIGEHFDEAGWSGGAHSLSSSGFSGQRVQRVEVSTARAVSYS